MIESIERSAIIRGLTREKDILRERLRLSKKDNREDKQRMKSKIAKLEKELNMFKLLQGAGKRT